MKAPHQRPARDKLTDVTIVRRERAEQQTREHDWPEPLEKKPPAASVKRRRKASVAA
jgi:hypothetical protein